MFKVLKLFIGVLTGSGGIADKLKEAYVAKQNATTDKEKIRADADIQYLAAQKEIILKEQDRAMTAWIRPALAFPVVVFWTKIIIWDITLGWGITENPSEQVWWYLTLIPAAYFVVRPWEKRR